MSEKLQVVITGSNGVSRVFTEVTRDAQTMGTAVEAAGKKGSASFTAWQGAAQKVGAGIAALTLISSRAAAESEASQARVETAFTNAGLAVDDYADSLERAAEAGIQLGFDDEDTADSVAKLVAITKDYDQAIRDLTLAQNIARQERISLAAATDIVEAAEAGRFRALGQLGIVLDETATKEDYLAAAQAKYAGAAQNYAETSAAGWDRIQIAAGNALEDIGSKLTAVQGPLLALSAGGAVLGGVKDVFDEVRNASATTGLLSSTLGKAGLAGAAAVAVAGLGYLAIETFQYKDAADAAKESTAGLTEFLYRLNAAGKDQEFTGEAKEAVDDFNALAKSGADAAWEIEQLRAQLVDASAELQSALAVNDSGLIDAAYARIDALNAEIDTLDDYALSYDQIKSIQENIQILFTQPGINAEKAAEGLRYYFDEFRAGRISAEVLVNWIKQDATQTWTRYTDAVILAADAQAAFAAQAEVAYAAMNTQVGVLDKLLEPKRVIAAAEQALALGFVADAMVRTAEESTEAANPITDVSDALQRQVDRAAAAEDAVRGYAEALGEIPAIADTNAARLGANASAAGAALGDAFRVAVGNTDAIGNQSGQVAKWAEELISVSGEYGKIDDLLKSGAINLETYNAAQEAGNRIFDANARIQEDILAIQAQQAPILADLTDEQARYLDHLATLPAEQQAVRLAYMDTATAAKAQEAAALAAAAANGELGEAGEETATKLIQGAADADPYLKMLLEDMGLISVGADGTITVNFGSVQEAGASIDDLYNVLKDLRDIIAEAFDVNVTTNAGSTRAELESIVGLLNGLDGRSVTYFVNASGDGVSVGSPTGVGITQGTGGVIPAANGYAGDVLVGEFGPELLRRNGGGALVLPTGATQSRMAMGGAPNVTININGVGKSTEEIVGELVPAIQLAFEQYYAGMGVR